MRMKLFNKNHVSKFDLFDHFVYFDGDDGAAAAAEAAAAAKAASDAAAAKALADAAAALEAVKIKPTDAEAKLLKEVMTNKKKLEAADAEKADLAAKLAAFDGIDPVAIKALLAANKEAEKAALTKAGDFDRLKKMMADEHAAELAKATKAASDAAAKTAAADARIGDLTVGAAFNTSDFVSKELVLPPAKARALYGAHFEIEGDTVVAYDKPKGETARTKLVNASGSPLSFEEFDQAPGRCRSGQGSSAEVEAAGGAGSGTTKVGATIVAKPGALKGMERIKAALLAQKAVGK